MTTGLILTALSLGFRHGVDWDHIAAIADLSSSAENRRRGFVLSFLYASGHAAVVFGLGVLAILFGANLPSGADVWMGRFVGLTLVAMGAWIIFDLLRSGRDFRLRSRWILILNGTFAGLRRVRNVSRRRSVVVEHDHAHPHSESLTHDHHQAHDHAHALAQVPDRQLAGFRSRWGSLSQARITRHRHSHTHELSLGEDVRVSTGNGTAAGIGVLHGIGFESPTQIAVFVASTSIVGASPGLVLLLAWVAGLLLANSALAALAGFGLLHAERN
ncbi:MAG: hypothetical protein V3V01_03845, partial [Acidimicrobiales bacterium]